jgi:ribonuclease E
MPRPRKELILATAKAPRPRKSAKAKKAEPVPQPQDTLTEPVATPAGPIEAVAAAVDAADVPLQEVPAASDEQPAVSPEASRRRASRKAARRKTPPEPAPDAAGVCEPAAAAPEAPPELAPEVPAEAAGVGVTASAPAVEAGAEPATEVERSGEMLVVRFPPVAPPPFPELPGTAPAPQRCERGRMDDRAGSVTTGTLPPGRPPELAGEAATTAVETPPAPEEVERVGRRRRRRRRSKKAPAPGNAAGPAAPAPAAPSVRPAVPTPVGSEPGAVKLSPSKKRRLRRKRRLLAARAAAGMNGVQAPSPNVSTEAPASAPAHFDADSGEVEAEPDTFAEQFDQVESVELEGEAPQTPGKRRSRRAREPVPEVVEIESEPEPAAPGSKEMIINVMPGEECRIAILHRGKLEELYIERASAENHVGNIYKGVVTNVEASIQAAFVDFGLGKNGFLHISDLHPQYFPNGSQIAENVGRKLPRRKRPPIQRCLRRGQEVIVQVTKEGIGTKGPTLSTYLSIPGRFLVMMPGMRQLGVSRKIEDEEVRARLRALLGELDLPEGMGFIARTAAQGRTKRELQSDLRYLMRLWNAVQRRIAEEPAPAELYRESDLVIRTIRDVYSPEIGKIIVDDEAVAQRAREFLRIFSPRSGDVVQVYKDPTPIFHRYGIEAELERLHSRHVPLRSGGSLIIEPTEALVAIDVNSGRCRGEEDAETTALKINLEAADEIARQLRLRDLGGVIICDFIDMREEAHKRAVERRLAANLRKHKERAKILRMSQFGIIEMTRQRQRASLTRSVYQDCRYCRGTGLVKTAESVVLDVMRTIQLNIIREPVRLIEITVSPEVAMLLLNRKRAALAEMEARNRRTISIRPDSSFGLDQVEVRCYDHRGRLLGQA